MRLASLIVSVVGGILVRCSISAVAAQSGPRSGWYVGGGIGPNWASGMDQEGFWCRQRGELAIMGYGASQNGTESSICRTLVRR